MLEPSLSDRNNKAHRVIVFARAPSLGRVKTRLNSALSLEQVLALHERLVRHAIANADDTPDARVELWVDDNPFHTLFTELQAQYPELCMRQQPPGDLGAKMSTALAASTDKDQASIIIGSDCPAIDGQYLQAAINALSRHDLVIGPASDGGYVLIGTRSQSLPVFQSVDWGTERVLQQTLDLAAQSNLSVRLLAELSDIDRPSDLGEAKRFGLLDD